MPIETHRKVILDLLKDVEDQKNSVCLLGSTISDSENLARAAEILRNPRYETFQYIFTKNDKVVGVTALSFRLVNVSASIIGKVEPYTDELVSRAKKVNADKYFFLHNHPSGNPTPSKQDIFTTVDLVKHIRKKSSLEFQGHVVINSKHYSVINGLGHYSINPIRYENSYDLNQKRNKETLFNQTIHMPEELAALAKQVQKSTDCFQMVGLTTKNELNSLFDMNYDIFKMSDKRLLASVKKWAYASGVAKFGLVNFDERKLTFDTRRKIFTQMEKSGLILDIITPDGNSYRSIGKFSPMQDIRYKRRKTKVVHEYSQEYKVTKPDELYFDNLFEWAEQNNSLSVHEGNEPQPLDTDLLEAYRRAVDALNRVQGEAMQKAFEATQVNADAVSNEIIQDIDLLSRVMHGNSHENQIWDHVSKSFVDEDLLPSLTGYYTNTPQPEYVKNLVRKYTFKINGAQTKISQANSHKHKR